MPCFRPLTAFRDSGGGVVFHTRGSGAATRLELPCGQCRGCRAERARQWSLRCVHEAQMHDKNSFITLTYSGENLPSDGSLRLEDWQKFAKRLRKRVGKFRFFMCGEYGDENLRPHYHALLFGVDFDFDRFFWRRGKRKGDRIFRSPTLEGTWGLGNCEIGSVTRESAEYVARYVMKKSSGGDLSRYVRVNGETGEEWKVKPEFCTMSRNPGVGAKWFDKFMDDVYPQDEVVLEGRRFRPPRFYDERFSALPSVSARSCPSEWNERSGGGSSVPVESLLPASGEAVMDLLKSRRRRRVRERKDDLSSERLVVRERLAELRYKLFSERKI